MKRLSLTLICAALGAAGLYYYQARPQCHSGMSMQDVADYRNIDVALMPKLQKVKGLDPLAVCTLPQALLDKSIHRLANPKPDHPGEAAAFRYQQQKGDADEVTAQDWQTAWQQVQRLQQQPRPLTAGIEPTTWEWLGPGNIGGRVRALMFDPDDADRIFAGSVSGGLWVTDNAGGSWSPVNDFMANLAISSIVVDPANKDTFYAGTGEGVYALHAARGAGIFKSVDSGNSWSLLSSTSSNSHFNYVNRMAFSTDGDKLYAATNSGIYVSDDDGASWSRETTARTNDIDAHPTDKDKAVAGTWSGVYYTTDGGANWQQATGFGSTDRVEVEYADSNPEVVYASINQNSGEVWRSTDGGKSFSRVNTGTGYLSSQGWYNNALWVDPLDDTHVIVGGLDNYRSTNSGSNFTKISLWYRAPNSAHADNHLIVSHPDYNGTTNNQVFFTNDGGVYRADDITTTTTTSGWTELNNTLGITQFYGIGVTSDGTIVGGTQDNGTLVYKGDSEGWSETFGGDGGYSAADPNDPNYLYGEYVYLQIHRSTNGGSSSNYIYDDDMTNDGPLFIAPFILDPNNSNRLLGGARQLWATDDAKASSPSWRSIKSRISSSSQITAIAVAPGNSDIIYVGHNNGEIYKTTNGTDASPSWQSVDGASMPGRAVLRILVNNQDNDQVWASFSGFYSNNLWYSDDGASNWQQRTGSGGTALPSAPIRSVVNHSTRSGLIYVGTEVGVFASEDNGASWSADNEGPANVSVDELIWQDENTLLAATYGRGIFRAKIFQDVTPDAFAFNALTDQSLNQPLTSNTVTITGIESAATISVTNGEYAIGCEASAFTSSTSTIENNQTVCVRHTSAGSYASTQTTTLDIGGITADFSSTTVNDTQVDAFSFNAVTDAALSTLQQSNTVTISGIGAAVTLSISNGEYSLGCNTTFASANVQVDAGDSFCVRHTSSDQNNTQTVTQVTVGDYSTAFTSTTLPDTGIDAVSFTPNLNVALSSMTYSNSITISGIQADVAVSIDNGEYGINCTNFTSAASTISNGQTLCVRHTSASTYATNTTSTLSIGGTEVSFSSTTQADTSVDPVSFDTKTSVPLNTLIESDPATISGASGPVSISVLNGEYSIDCSGTYTSAQGTISNDQTLCLRHTSADDYQQSVTTHLTLGNQVSSFSSTTGKDEDIDTVSFDAQIEVNMGTQITSNTVTISGLSDFTTISVENGEYAIGCSADAFTSEAGQIANLDTVCVRHTSAISALTQTQTALTVGNSKLSFSSTTAENQEPDPISFTSVSDASMDSQQTSNRITVTGITAPVSISIENGEYSLDCEDNGYTSALGIVQPNQSLCVRHTSAATASTAATTKVTIGTRSVEFTSTTQSASPKEDTSSDDSGSEESSGGSLGALLMLGLFALRRRTAIQ